MIGFAEARAFIDVVVKKFLDIELLLSTSNATQIDNVSLLCTKLHLVFCEQKRTNELLTKVVGLLQRQDVLLEPLSAEHYSKVVEITNFQYGELKEYLKEKEPEPLLELVLKQKQEIEEQFTKDFPQ